MSITKEEFNIEREYLSNVINVFDNKFKEELENFSNIKKRVSKLRKHLIENKDNMDAGEISQIRQAIERMILTGDVTNKKYALLQKVQKSPYFARLDFEDHTFNELYKMYIGLTSIYKKGQDKYLVYDWRSPAASMYYEKSVGQASYEAPAGTIDGEIILKRQYKIENRELEFVFDNNINIDDELLKEALVKNSSAKMKNIVNSIQKEQNLVIRNQNDDVLIIDGPAGSGKTSVALHRIAFLLYRDREHLKAENIVILSPNQVFSEYISSVLPELGEDNVDYLTFSEYYVSLTKKYTVAQNFNNYVKNLYEQTNPLEVEVNKFKASNSFKKFVDEYYNKLENGFKFKEIKFKQKTALTKEEYKEFYFKKYKKFKLEERMEHLIQKAVLNVYENLSIYERTKITKGQISKVIRPQMKFNLKIESLYSNMFKDLELLNKHLTASYKITAKELSDFVLKGLDKKELNYDDLVAMAYLKSKISNIESTENVKHLVIDEAQDYSLMQFEVIKETFKSAKYTILGDVNQAINPYLKYSNFSPLQKVFAKRKTKPFSLQNCYRNSFEISNFSNSLLGLTNVKAVNRKSGLPVVYTNLTKKQITNSIIQNVKKMKAKGFKQIGIITKTTNSAKELYNSLKQELTDVNYVDFSTSSFEEGVSVLGSYTSKGLEFDGVISANYENAYTKNTEKNLLYVVFTRALHELIVYNENENLGLLANIDKKFYIKK